MDTDGLIKVLADAATDEILGVHMIGPRIAHLIAEAVVSMEYRASARYCPNEPRPPHSNAEAFKEAGVLQRPTTALCIFEGEW